MKLEEKNNRIELCFILINHLKFCISPYILLVSPYNLPKCMLLIPI